MGRSQQPGKSGSVVKWVLFASVILTGLAGAVFFPLGEWVQAFVDYVRATGPIGVAAYAVVYVAATVLLIPGSLLTIGAGSVYGLAGVALVMPAALVGATLAFVLGRYLARDWVSARIARRPRMASVDAAIGDRGFTIIFLLRLSPLVPFTVFNYAMGITRARLRDYVLASAIGMLPGAFLYVYIGTSITDLVALAGDAPDTGSYGRIALWVGLATTLIATILITRLARNRLERTLASE